MSLTTVIYASCTVSLFYRFILKLLFLYITKFYQNFFLNMIVTYCLITKNYHKNITKSTHQKRLFQGFLCYMQTQETKVYLISNVAVEFEWCWIIRMLSKILYSKIWWNWQWSSSYAGLISWQWYWQYNLSVWDVGCSGCGVFEMWDVWDVEYLRYGIFWILDVRNAGCSDAGCLGGAMFRMWDVEDVEDVGCSRCGIFVKWDFRDVECLGCKMCNIYQDVECWFTKFRTL